MDSEPGGWIPPRGRFTAFRIEDVEQSIPERFLQVAERFADQLAVCTGEDSLTYGELEEWSARVATALLEASDSRRPVLILVGQGPALAAAILGTLRAGRIYVPQDPAASLEGIERVVAESRPSLVVTEHRHLRAAEKAAAALQVLLVEGLPGKKRGKLPRIEAGSPACLYFTSGSTGRPRGVLDCHRNVLHNVLRYTNSLAIGPDDRLSLVQSPGFSGAVSSLFCALLNGAAVFPYDLHGEGLRGLAEWAERERLTMFHGVPFLFEQLCRTTRSLPDLRVIRLEGDRADSRHGKMFQQRFGPECVLINGLGTTETGLVTQFPVFSDTQLVSGALPVGFPVRDVEVELIGPDSLPVDPGSIGEIVVRSRYLAMGYWERPDRTEAAFSSRDGVSAYRTGDLGRLDDEGRLVHEGRLDFVASVRGQRVDTAIVEEALQGLADVERAVVVARDDRFVAYIVPSGERTPPADRLRRELRKRLPAAAVPTRFIPLDAVPLDANGKVVRRDLPAPGRRRPVLETPFVAPREGAEKTLCDLFGRALDIEPVGVLDDFFDLGGDSLAAARLSADLDERLGIILPAEVFRTDLTVTRVADWLTRSHRHKALVGLAGEGLERVPLYLFHDYPGHLLAYAELARLLGRVRPVLGFQRTESATSRSGRSVPQLAAAYVTEIVRAQPRGPYLLSGQCFGGLLAFEAARCLRETHDAYTVTLLLDPAFPRGPLRALWARALNSRHRPELRGAGPARWVRYVGRMALRITSKLPGAARLRTVADVHFSAEGSYQVKPSGGTVFFIANRSRSDADSWRKVCRGRFEVVQLESRPEAGHLTDPAVVEELAVEVERILELTDEAGAARLSP